MEFGQPPLLGTKLVVKQIGTRSKPDQGKAQKSEGSKRDAKRNESKRRKTPP